MSSLIVAALFSCLAGGAAEAAEPSPVLERIAPVIDRFHNLEFEQSLAAAREIEREFPGHPAGPFYSSVVHYQRVRRRSIARPSAWSSPARPKKPAVFWTASSMPSCPAGSKRGCA
ncbi:MAG: hypothetical protein ABII00_06855 [Elusimicrobiota bacterium]